MRLALLFQSWRLPVLVGAAFLFPVLLSAQFKAGDWLAHANGLYRYSRLDDSEQRLYEYALEGTFHFFPAPRLAMGAALTTTYLSLDNDFFQAHDLSFSVEPQLRYYLTNKKAPLFLQAGYSWRQTERARPANSEEKQTAKGSGASAGLGANFPLKPSVSLEGMLVYRYQKQEDVQNPSETAFRRGLQAGATLRIFLSEQEEAHPSWWGPGEEAVQASGWILGGNFEGGLNFENPNTFSLSLLGGSFLARRFALGLGLELERGANDQFGDPGLNSAIESFLRYYLPLSNSMMAFPTVGFQGGRSEVFDSFNLEAFRFRTWRLGMGLDLFLSESSALELILNLSGRNISPTGNAIPDRNFDVAFSLSVGLITFWYK